MLLSDILPVLDAIAPTRNAEAWDNVGLLVGDPAQQITSGMLTIDYTPEVACEAAGAKADLIIAYHPPIFDAIKRITEGSLVFDAIRRGVAIYSPHTALDVAEGGTNDMLADAVGLGERQPLKLIEPKSKQQKLIVFVPEHALEKISEALFAAGAGHIGNYSSCSFQSRGEGTFFGEEGTKPSVGQAGRLERAEEVRLETVVPVARIDEIVRALRESHPYEEPAFDLVPLAAAPEGIGMGRIGALAQPTAREEVFDRIKRELGIEHLLVAGPQEGSITRAAVCAGACGNFLEDAIAQKAELYLTGEIRHHDAIKAARAGMTVVCTLHSNSERAVLKRLRDRLAKEVADVKFQVSATDKDPFQVT